MSAQPTPRLTVAEYLDAERTAEIKSEYFDGEVFAMSGGILVHARIGAALIQSLGNNLRKGCHVASSDLRVRVSERGPFFYPDVTVYCENPQLADDFKDTLLNPTIIFEVLSRTSEAYDRGRKFAAYRRIESLREYVLVSQTEPSIESYSRGSDKWLFTEFNGIGAVCKLSSVDCEIPLSAVYSVLND